jgi:Flp pilus assembly protein TadG
MSILAKAGSLLKRFRTAQQGQVALTFGLAAVPLFMFAGGAVDFASSSAVHTRLQSALDSAALAAASSKGLDEAKRIELARRIFKENWEAAKTAKDLTASATFTVEGNAVKGQAATQMPTAFMRIVGINTFDIASDVSISIPKGKKAEVALVLDYSGSMRETSGGQVKYVAMKEAAKRLVDDLSKQAPGQVKIGLVPFSQDVYVTLPKEFVVGQAGSGDWTGCTQDRKYPHNITDTAPDPDNDDTKWGQERTTNRKDDGCGPYKRLNLKVRPLTGDFNAINDQLDAMRPYHWTHVALGAEFGWHLLAPKEPFNEGAAYSDSGTQKIMVILSDGRQTVDGFGESGRRDEDSANENFLKICKRADKKGIRVMTIAFDMKDEPEARARMRSCASDATKDYFEPETGDDVARVFAEIQTQIAAQIFISE